MAIEKPVWIGLLKFKPKGEYDVAFFDWGETTQSGTPKVVIKIDNPYQKKVDPRKDLGKDIDDDIPF